MRMDKRRLCATTVIALATTSSSGDIYARSEYSLPLNPMTLDKVISGAGPAAARMPFRPLTVLPASDSNWSANHPAGVPGYAADLAAIEQRRTLRVLMLREQGSQPWSGDLAVERQLIREFAEKRRLAVDWAPADSPRELLQGLRDGLGDVVIGEVPLDLEERLRIARTVALGQIRYVVVTRADTARMRRPADLYGRRAGMSQSSPAWPLLQRLSAGHPPIELVPTDGLSPEELLAQLAAGAFDFTVVPEKRFEQLLSGHAGLRVAFPLSGNRPVAWLVRSESSQLLAALNDLLNRKHQLVWRPSPTRSEDLSGIAARGVLRVITRPDPDNYFLSQGERAGFEYDMIREFARRKRLRMEVLVGDSDAQMLAWLVEGVGDVVTARVDPGLVDTDRSLAATRTYHYVAPVLVARADLADPASLQERRVMVPRGSMHARILGQQRRAGTGGNFDLIEVPADRTPMELADQVVQGQADFTVVEGTRLDETLAYRSELRPVMSLAGDPPYRFTVRAGNPGLLSALNEFLRKEYGSEFYNAARRRYFENDDLYALKGGAFDRISPYDDLVQRYADRYSFDWRLIVAQMYEESRFDPDVVSPAGARGLMQVLPLTARDMGFGDLTQPETAIHAGIKYLAKQRDRFEATLPVGDRTWFSLAAYHAGYDRVRAARRRAVKLGLDPDRWFAHVEQAMLDISRNAGGGDYRGGRSSVMYVREIRSRYAAYLQLRSAALASLQRG